MKKSLFVIVKTKGDFSEITLISEKQYSKSRNAIRLPFEMSLTEAKNYLLDFDIL